MAASTLGGHADLAGACKFDHVDVRNVLERASARETAARVAVGGLAKCLLGCFSIRIVSHTLRIGRVRTRCFGVAANSIAARAINSFPVGGLDAVGICQF